MQRVLLTVFTHNLESARAACDLNIISSVAIVSIGRKWVFLQVCRLSHLSVGVSVCPVYV